jgi:hypothetical protein
MKERQYNLGAQIRAKDFRKKPYVSQNRQRVAAWLDPTTQAQRRRPRGASIATATGRRRSLQRWLGGGVSMLNYESFNRRNNQ